MAEQTIYALLVGINDYLSPNISNLNGTQNDLIAVRTYLENNYQGYRKSIKELPNSKATRANVIQYFEQHLGQANEGDIALFYFSGHGSQSKTNKAFLKFDQDGKEEGLVCHDSRVDGNFDLADKEMAVLLSYIARNNAEVIVLIDSCHSGSVTREADPSIRLTSSFHQPRALSDYLYDATIEEHKSYYSDLYAENNNEIPVLPLSRHVLLSACHERELARETKDGGWFTQALIQTLEAQPLRSYFQVYSQVLANIAQRREKQTPQLEAYGLFNANRVFLTGEKSQTKSKRFKIEPSAKGNMFTINLGVQSGIPLEVNRPINFNIYESENSEELVGVGTVKSIGLVISEMRINFPKATQATAYWGEILDYALAPLMVCFEGAQEDLDLLNAALKEQAMQQVMFVPNDLVCPFVLAWDQKDACYRLSERQQEAVWNPTTASYETKAFNRPVFILEIGKADLRVAAKVRALIEVLEHLSQWKYTVDLDNPKSKIKQQSIELTFTTSSAYDADKVQCLVQEGTQLKSYSLAEANQSPQKNYHQLVLDYTEEEPIGYSVSIKNNSRETYHLALALISADYGVIPLQSNITLAAGEELQEAIDPNYGSLLIDKKRDTSISNYLKVFIARKEISTIQGLGLPSLALEEQLQHYTRNNNKSRNFAPRVDLNDWCTKTLTLQLKRPVKLLSKDSLAIDNRGVIIHGHNSFSANVVLDKPAGGTRAGTQIYEQIPRAIAGFELFFMNDPATYASVTSIELTNIKDEVGLAEDPLKLSVPNLQEALVFPFTTETILVPQEDGSFQEEVVVLPLGVSAGQDEQGNNLYEISDLPTNANKGTRSLGKALRMYFGKLFLGRANYHLCWVDYERGGIRQQDDVAKKVATANRVLLILHGIIGDTGAMAKNLEFAKHHYDVVLTYDYENLNTSIVTIAAQLKKVLGNAGIVEGGDKVVDIVAHSMGGLVARTLIESPSLRGNLFVRNLYMLGTPNGGSAFSKITDYRDLLGIGMVLALNLKLFTAAILARTIKGINITNSLTTTLAEMGADSPFLVNLNNHPIPKSVQYYVIAGDISNYKTQATSLLARWMDKAVVRVGRLVYGKKENDIAVATKSILAVPAHFQPITKEVDCHHMIYFTDEQSMTILENWMKDNK